MALNERQQRFVLAYDGNATEAARKAGYEGDSNTLGVTGFELLRNPNIKTAIDARMAEVKRKLIGSKLDRQKWLRDVMDDPSAKLSDKLKAAELLSKTEGDLLQKIEHSVSDSLSSAIEQTLEKKNGN